MNPNVDADSIIPTLFIIVFFVPFICSIWWGWYQLKNNPIKKVTHIPVPREYYFKSLRMHNDAFKLCPAHAKSNIKKGQMALLTHKNCTECQKEKLNVK